MSLHGRPQGIRGEFFKRPARPFPVVALAHPWFHVETGLVAGRTLAGKDRLGGLLRAVEGGRDEGVEFHGRHGVRNTLDLCLPLVVEEDSRAPSGQDARGVGRGSSMTDQDDGGHVATVGRNVRACPRGVRTFARGRMHT